MSDDIENQVSKSLLLRDMQQRGTQHVGSQNVLWARPHFATKLAAIFASISLIARSCLIPQCLTIQLVLLLEH